MLFFLRFDEEKDVVIISIQIYIHIVKMTVKQNLGVISKFLSRFQRVNREGCLYPDRNFIFIWVTSHRELVLQWPLRHVSLTDRLAKPLICAPTVWTTWWVSPTIRTTRAGAELFVFRADSCTSTFGNITCLVTNINQTFLTIIFFVIGLSHSAFFVWRISEITFWQNKLPKQELHAFFDGQLKRPALVCPGSVASWLNIKVKDPVA